MQQKLFKIGHDTGILRIKEYDKFKNNNIYDIIYTL